MSENYLDLEFNLDKDCPDLASLIDSSSLEDLNNLDSAENWRSLFVVGDDAQSIYGFRGAKVEIILVEFARAYHPMVQKIILNQNYRSTQNILDLAEQILSHNPQQHKKNLFTTNPSSIPVYFYRARNEKDEAEYILRRIWFLYKDQANQSTNDNSLQTQQTTNTNKVLETEEEIFKRLLDKFDLGYLDTHL